VQTRLWMEVDSEILAFAGWSANRSRSTERYGVVIEGSAPGRRGSSGPFPMKGGDAIVAIAFIDLDGAMFQSGGVMRSGENLAHLGLSAVGGPL
jgi:hypothetical protein